MMARVAVVCAMLACGLLSTRAAAAEAPALPVHAQLGELLKLDGTGSLTACTYRLKSWWLALSDGDPRQAPALFTRRLEGEPRSLKAGPGSRSFEVLSRLPSGGDALVSLMYRSGHVVSAIDGIPSGTVTGDESVILKANEIVVRRHDPSHQGSIPYRWQISYLWQGGKYRGRPAVLVPDMPAIAYPLPRAEFHPSNGNTILLKLEVAADEESRDTGLMHVASLDGDSGMIFEWPYDTQVGFWMLNTLIPLSIAFLSAGGKILWMDDMQPNTTTIHQPPTPYRFAIEANLGFFRSNGIRVGDVVELDIP